MEASFTSRFSSADWFGETRMMTIGGAGTIGTWLSLLLARTGEHKLLIYDDDDVSEYNMAGQLFRKSDIGKKKVRALQEIILDYTDHNESSILCSENRITSSTKLTPVVFSCFDNMKARKTMFETWCKMDNREIFIDGRMSIESYEIYCVRKGDEEKYKETLFSDDSIPPQICSLKSTSHTGAMIAARMTTLLVNHFANIRIGIDIRTIPFSIREDLELMNYKNE